MKRTIPFFAIALLLFVTSCSSSKKAGSAAGTAIASGVATDTGTKDGSSFEKAIAVKNIDAEYAYVKKVCPGCTFKKQALRQNNKKYYDVLYFEKDGSEVVYYFDINSFYGKSF